MNVRARMIGNKVFTAMALFSVLLVVASLVVILLPILYRGAGAVVFKATTEFRRLQLEKFNRGDYEQVRAESAALREVASRAWQIHDSVGVAVDPSDIEDKSRQLHRELAKQLENRNLPTGEIRRIRKASEAVRDAFAEALACEDKSKAIEMLDSVIAQSRQEPLKDTVAAGVGGLAARYKSGLSAVEDIGATRKRLLGHVKEVRQALWGLLGPRPGDSLPALDIEQYGATRWDKATELLTDLTWRRAWTPGPTGQLELAMIPRESDFAGTPMAELVPFVRDNVGKALHPRWTFYWGYFVDDNLSGHYFGGVGPEIIGTLLITVLSILIAMPLGVIAAAYLVECAGDTPATRALRMCINTLAGVPSIVFGLFGMAFFVVYLLPKLGAPRGSSILAGSLTLALLVLPVVIRASEEAIRAVPQAYKEAAFSLGASRFRCFMSVTLPAALPGVLTGMILSMSRAAGETAPILFTAAVAAGPVPSSIFQPTRTLSYGSYDMAVGDKMAMMAPHNQFGMVMTLVAIVLLLNLVAIVIRGRMSRKLRGQ